MLTINAREPTLRQSTAKMVMIRSKNRRKLHGYTDEQSRGPLDVAGTRKASQIEGNTETKQ